MGTVLFFHKYLEGVEELWMAHRSFPLPFPMPCLGSSFLAADKFLYLIPCQIPWAVQ